MKKRKNITPEQMDIGKRIKEARTKLAMSREHMAEELNVSTQSVYNWETGRNIPALELLASLCQLLHMTVQFLLTGKEFSSVCVSV